MKFKNRFLGPSLNLVWILLFLFGTTCKGQDIPKIIDIGIEFQAYPTGLLPGVRATFGLNSKNAIHLRAGLNIINHRDLGVQDKETGLGGGFTLGYEHYFGENLTQWFLGIRTDLWFNSIDWENQVGANPANFMTGTSNIIVLQPTITGGYLFEFGDRNWSFAPSLGFGFEANIYTNGEDVGQGLIGLIGIVVAKRFGASTN